MLQNISISDKCCSSELSIHQRNLKKLNCFQHNNNNNNKNNKHFCAANLNIRMISVASCDWLKLNYEITGIDYILKCIQIENSYFK